MNYYEELGVLPNASVDEIRHAYKALARVLHPDQFPDEKLKQVADLQMKRLNQILAVLVDPEERLRYNLSLKAPVAVPSRRVWEVPIRPEPERIWSRPWAVGLCAWLPPIAGVLLFVGGIVYYGTTAGGPSRASVAESDALAPLAVPAVSATTSLRTERTRVAEEGQTELLAELKASRQELNALRAEHQKLLDQLSRSSRSPIAEEAASELPRLKPPAPDVHPPIVPVRSEIAPIEHPAPAAARLAGHWYYVPESREAPPKGVYVPEYIELRVTEDRGTLRGRYHARYRVTDQAISPEVTFQFEGPGGPAAAELPWSGAGDAQGNMAIRLISADQMEVSWTATHLSADLNLAAGTAHLIRQRESR